MALSRTLRSALVESPRSLGEYSRKRRWALLERLFPELSAWRIVDLGGTASTWLRAPTRPAHVMIVNMTESELGLPPTPVRWLYGLVADACDPPEELLAQPFDFVFSNSLIEHVGGHARRRRLAEVVEELAPRHWVQTPYRYFPIEPHWLFPGFQFLPVAAQAWLSLRWPLMHTRAATPRIAMGNVLEVELLSKAEMTYYFPHSRIIAERVGPLVKSLVAVRR